MGTLRQVLTSVVLVSVASWGVILGEADGNPLGERNGDFDGDLDGPFDGPFDGACARTNKNKTQHNTSKQHPFFSLQQHTSSPTNARQQTTTNNGGLGRRSFVGLVLSVRAKTMNKKQSNKGNKMQTYKKISRNSSTANADEARPLHDADPCSAVEVVGI